jgi:hypothetical protein
MPRVIKGHLVVIHLFCLFRGLFLLTDPYKVDLVVILNSPTLTPSLSYSM